MIGRRLLTIPAYLLLTVLLTAMTPLLLVLAWLIGRLPGARAAVPTLGLLLGYLWCETIGITVATWLWLRHRDRQRFLQANYRLQSWWAATLKRIAERLFRLDFHITGQDALSGDGALMLPRHASIADTLIPMVFYAIPRQIRLRYVLKRELLLDPCLDIVGNRLPNCFVDRSGEDSAGARAGIARLVAGMAADEGLLLFPEGTRYSIARVRSLRSRWREDPERLGQLDRWSHVLPPRTGGFLAALDANPGKDLIFCAHTGFEGSSHFRTLINGAWSGARIRIHFWRVPFAAIPHDRAARALLLFEQWDRMAHWVSLHSSTGGIST
jgi:1-acyl-sn-glycerol-3-phosphate acyltransferase